MIFKYVDYLNFKGDYSDYNYFVKFKVFLIEFILKDMEDKDQEKIIILDYGSKVLIKWFKDFIGFY